MHGLNLASLLIAVFIAGAYLALFVRALIGQSSDRRVNDAAVAALDPDALARLRSYIGEVDSHERDRMTLVRDGGSTIVHVRRDPALDSEEWRRELSRRGGFPRD